MTPEEQATLRMVVDMLKTTREFKNTKTVWFNIKLSVLLIEKLLNGTD